MAQSLAKLYVHVVFFTKGREALISDAWRHELFHVLGGTSNNLGCQVLIVGGVPDHLHMLIQLARTITFRSWNGRSVHARSFLPSPLLPRYGRYTPSDPSSSELDDRVVGEVDLACAANSGHNGEGLIRRWGGRPRIHPYGAAT
jgi:hypothetical protein